MKKGTGTILKSWNKFLKEQFNIIRRNQPNFNRQRSYDQVKVQKQFDQLEKERSQTRIQLMEYKAEVEKKYIQKQLFLRDNIMQLRTELQQSDLQPEVKEKALKRLGLMEEDGEYTDIVRMDDMSKFESFRQFKEALTQDKKKIVGNSPKQMNIKRLSREEMDQRLSELDTILDDIHEQKLEFSAFDASIEDTELNHTILQGSDRRTVLNHIRYLQTLTSFSEGSKLHPETQRSIEEVSYRVENNLPVSKEALYDICPFIFQTELEQIEALILDREEKRHQVDFDEGSFIQGSNSLNAENARTLKLIIDIKISEYKMDMVIDTAIYELQENHADYFKIKEEQGYFDSSEILWILENSPENELTDEEVAILKEIRSIWRMMSDFKNLQDINHVRMFNEMTRIKYPPWVQRNPELKKRWESFWANSFGAMRDITDLASLPEGEQEPDLDSALNEMIGKDKLQQLISNSKQEYRQKLLMKGEGDAPPEDIHAKNDHLVTNMHILGNALHRLEEKQSQRRSLTVRDIPHLFSGDIDEDRPSEGRILHDELTKALLLNNTNPSKYNIEYWSTYFNIEPQQLKNTFNYVSYPILDEGEGEIVRILRFVNL